MCQEFVEQATLRFDPVNVKFEEWGPKIIQFGAFQNKSSTAYLLKIASEDTPVGKLLVLCTCKTYVLVNILS